MFLVKLLAVNQNMHLILSRIQFANFFDIETDYYLSENNRSIFNSLITSLNSLNLNESFKATTEDQ